MVIITVQVVCCHLRRLGEGYKTNMRDRLEAGRRGDGTDLKILIDTSKT